VGGDIDAGRLCITLSGAARRAFCSHESELAAELISAC
jgi:hypothetical protein